MSWRDEYNKWRDKYDWNKVGSREDADEIIINKLIEILDETDVIIEELRQQQKGQYYENDNNLQGRT